MRYKWPRIGTVIAVAAVVGFLVWLLAIRDDGDEAESGTVVATEVAPFGPGIAGEEELRDAAGRVGHDVYWAGSEEKGEVELTVTADGRAFVRYLTGDAKPGAGKANFLTVATYEIADAGAVLEEVAGREGRESFPLEGGGLAVVNTAEPDRVYFTPEGSELQVEVFHPDPGKARELVESGQVQPIG